VGFSHAVVDDKRTLQRLLEKQGVLKNVVARTRP